jgi:hypothetical protein
MSELIMWMLVLDSAREVFGHIESIKILVILNLTGYMLTSFGFASFIRGIFLYRFPLTDHEFSGSLRLLTGAYFSNLTAGGSSL